MEHYVGLDVSLRLTAICIVDRTGKIEREGMVASNPEAIAAFVKSHAPQVARIGLEQAILYIERNPKLVRSITSFPYIANSL